MFGPNAILDFRRSRKQAARIPGLLQRLPNPYLIVRPNARSWHEGIKSACRSPRIPMAIPLPRPVPDTRSCLISQPSLALVRNDSASRPRSWDNSVYRMLHLYERNNLLLHGGPQCAVPRRSAFDTIRFLINSPGTGKRAELESACKAWLAAWLCGIEDWKLQAP